MKKAINKIFVCFLSLILSCVLFMPKTKEVSFAEEASQETKYSLISANFAASGETLNNYNISANNVSSFTPFDLDEGRRKEGKSFSFLASERNQILNQRVLVEENNVPEQNNSLYFFIYFDTIYLHNLTVTLKFDNGASLIWSLTTEELVELVKKTSSVSILSLPYAWNHVEFPFTKATQNGEIYSGGKLNSISEMLIDFSSEEIKSEAGEGEDGNIEEELQVNYSTLLFYDIYLAKSKAENYNAIEKQNYNVYAFNFYSADFINSICVGDTITLPNSYKTVVKYAWQGYKDLKNGNLSSVTWQIVVKTPDSKNPYLYPSFGDKLTFEKEGVYEIFYQCKDVSMSSTDPIISGSVKINARILKPVYFDKSSYSMKVGQTYVINVYTSNAFSRVTDVQFNSKNSALKINYNDGVLEVYSNVAGEYTVDITIKGVRSVQNQEKEYTETLKITVQNTESKTDKVWKIVLYSALGVFGLLFIGFLIIKAVEARKFKVK